MAKVIKILNNEEFEETINSDERVKRVLKELQGDLEIHNSQVVANYSDEGYACFEVILNVETTLVLSFISTAS